MNKETNRLYRFCNELLSVFTDYILGLDSFFSIPENIENNKFLYEEYKELGKNLRNLEEKYRK